MRARFLVFASAALFVCADAYAQFVPGQPLTPSAPPAPPASGSAQAPAPSTSAAPPSSAAPSTSAAPPSAPPASAAPAPPPAPPAPPASAAPAAPAPPATTAPESAAPPPGMAGEAFATHRAAESPASAWDVKGLLGFEIEARGGFMLPESASPITAPGLLPNIPGNPTGDLLNGNMSPYSYDPFAVALAAGYRFFPFLSAGLYFDYGTFQVNGGCDTNTVQCSDGTDQLQRQLWQLGVYGRYYLTTLHPRLQPWVEIGVGATEDTTSYTRGPLGNFATVNYYLTYWGLATNLKVGLDWRLSPWFSLGPFVGYSRVFALSGEVQTCPQSQTQTGNCDTTSPFYKDTSSAPVNTSGFGLFFGGIFLKLTLGPSLR